MTPPLLTIRELADYYRLCPATIRRWIREGWPDSRYYVKVRDGWRVRKEIIRAISAKRKGT
jgi:hypothetical protein